MKVRALDAGVSLATGYRYLHEGIDVLAAQAPDLPEALAAGAAAGWTHVTLDGTLVRTRRCRVINPDTGHDLWYSGKHSAHGGPCRSWAIPTGIRWRSPRSNPAAPTIWLPPGPPASSARCTPRPPCWVCRRWPTRA